MFDDCRFMPCMIGASWDLLPWFAAAGAAFIVVHALVKAIAGRRSRVR